MLENPRHPQMTADSTCIDKGGEELVSVTTPLPDASWIKLEKRTASLPIIHSYATAGCGRRHGSLFFPSALEMRALGLLIYSTITGVAAG